MQQSQQLHQLPASTARMLSSGQVILGPESVVKELLENALDAGATRLDVRLDGCGLDRLEVQDNGCGFPPAGAELVAMRHCTSKLRDDAGLAGLVTYGFRGEALNSLCSVGQLSMATRCQGEELGREYAFDKEGRVASRRDAAMPCGTRATVRQLFHCLPVRRQQLRSAKRLREALAAVEATVRAAALANPGVRLALLSDGEALLSLPECDCLAERVRQVLSYAVWQQLRRVECPLPLPGGASGRAVAFVPAPGADRALAFRAGEAHCFLLVNRRVVQSPKLAKVIRSTISAGFGAPNKLPVCVLSLELPSEVLDVNLNPSKTQIGIANEAAMLEALTAMLADVAATAAAPAVSTEQSLTDVSNVGRGRHSNMSKAVGRDQGGGAVEEAAAATEAATAASDDGGSGAVARARKSPGSPPIGGVASEARAPIDVTAMAMQANCAANAQLDLSSCAGGATDSEQETPAPSPARVSNFPARAARGDSAGIPVPIGRGNSTDFPSTAAGGNSADFPPRAAGEDSPEVPRPAKRPRVSDERVTGGGNSAENPSPPPAARAVPAYADLATMHRRRIRAGASCQAERLKRLSGRLDRPEPLSYGEAAAAAAAVSDCAPAHANRCRYVGALSDVVIGVGAGALLYGLRRSRPQQRSDENGDSDAAARELLESGGGRLLCKLA